MSASFRELRVWQEAMRLTTELAIPAPRKGIALRIANSIIDC